MRGRNLEILSSFDLIRDRENSLISNNKYRKLEADVLCGERNTWHYERESYIFRVDTQRHVT